MGEYSIEKGNLFWYEAHNDGSLYVVGTVNGFNGDPNNKTDCRTFDGKDVKGIGGKYLPQGLAKFGGYGLILKNGLAIAKGGLYNCPNLGVLEFETGSTGANSIDEFGLAKCAKLTSITDVDSFSSIGMAAFAGTTALRSFDLKDISGIGEFAFYESGITSITANAISAIPKYAFKRSSLSNFDIPSVTSIGEQAFAFCYALADVNFTNITSIAKAVFWGCTGLKKLVIPNAAIAGWAFYECNKLNDVTLGAGASLGQRVFVDAFDSTGSTLTIEKGCSFQEYSFYKANVTKVVLKCDSVPEASFMNCEFLTDIDFGSVTCIGKSAFRECKGLTKVYLPKTITTIEGAAFANCTLLDLVEYEGTKKEWKGIALDSSWCVGTHSAL